MTIEKIDEKEAALARRNAASLDLWAYFDRKSNEGGVSLADAVARIAEYRLRHGKPALVVIDAALDAIRLYVQLQGVEAHART